MTTLIVIVVVLAVGGIITFFGVRSIERAHPPRGRLIEVGGVRQHVLVLGPETKGEGPAIVMVHGAGANLEDMHLALGERLALNHRVILIDRPGFGWSERKDLKGVSSPSRQAEVLEATLDALGVDRIVMVGHSFGGTLALAYALKFPQRVAGLVLAAPPTHPRSRLLSWNNAILATPIGWLFARTLALPLGLPLLTPGVKFAFLPQSMPQDYVNRTASKLILRPASLMANWADVGGLHRFLTAQLGHYEKLTTPTAVFVGDRDPLVLPKYCQELAAMAPCVTVTVLEGYGHMIHHAAPDRIVAAVEAVARGG
jgi:pimeloyl-ACP methyl ester carboxylesterase